MGDLWNNLFGSNTKSGVLGTMGNLVGTLGNVWGTIENARQNKKITKMNLDLFNREKTRQDSNDSAFNRGFRLDLLDRR